jgi:hypothetical protein
MNFWGFTKTYEREHNLPHGKARQNDALAALYRRNHHNLWDMPQNL